MDELGVFLENFGALEIERGQKINQVEEVEQLKTEFENQPHVYVAKNENEFLVVFYDGLLLLKIILEILCFGVAAFNLNFDRLRGNQAPYLATQHIAFVFSDINKQLAPGQVFAWKYLNVKLVAHHTKH